MLERLEKVKQQAKGTIFEEFVATEIERYRTQKQKEWKRVKINNKWIDDADELFLLYKKIIEEYKPKIEPFVSDVEFVDKREEEARVLLVVTNFKHDVCSLQCVDMHTLDDYAKLEDEAFVESLDEEKEEGGVEFFFQRDEQVTRVKHSSIFKKANPLGALKKIVEPLILELFKRAFDLDSLMQNKTNANREEAQPGDGEGANPGS